MDTLETYEASVLLRGFPPDVREREARLRARGIDPDRLRATLFHGLVGGAAYLHRGTGEIRLGGLETDDSSQASEAEGLAWWPIPGLLEDELRDAFRQVAHEFAPEPRRRLEAALRTPFLRAPHDALLCYPGEWIRLRQRREEAENDAFCRAADAILDVIAERAEPPR